MSSTISLVLSVKGPIFWSLTQFVVCCWCVSGGWVFSCILLPSSWFGGKTYTCSSKTQFAFNCKGLTDVVSRFSDLREHASCIINSFYRLMYIYSSLF